MTLQVRLTGTVAMTRNTQQSEKLPLTHGVTVRTDNSLLTLNP